MKKNSKSSNRWSKIGLRFKLLWIWLLKNLSLVIKVSIITIAILVATNVIGSEDFLVQLLRLDELENINWASLKGIENAIAIIASAIITAFMFLKKTKHLAIEDIKSRDLKIALIKAHLYFNEDGKLCHREEKLEDIGMDEDQQIGSQNISNLPNENIITGVSRAASELKTVLTADLSEDEETVVEEEELNEEIIEETSIGLLDEEGVSVSSSEDNKSTNEIETETEQPKKKKENVFKIAYNKVYVYFSTLWKSIKLSAKDLKEPKLEDGIDQKKKLKKKVKEKKAIKEDKNKIEIIDTENESTDLLEENNKIENKDEKPTVLKSSTVQPEKPKISAKEQEIDDILKGLK